MIISQPYSWQIGGHCNTEERQSRETKMEENEGRKSKPWRGDKGKVWQGQLSNLLCFLHFVCLSLWYMSLTLRFYSSHYIIVISWGGGRRNCHLLLNTTFVKQIHSIKVNQLFPSGCGQHHSWSWHFWVLWLGRDFFNQSVSQASIFFCNLMFVYGDRIHKNTVSQSVFLEVFFKTSFT